MTPGPPNDDRQLATDPVQRGKVPAWFRRIIRQTFRFHGSVESWLGTDKLKHGFVDHPGELELPDGQKAFVTEVYFLSQSDVRELMEFSATTGVTYEITAQASWFPETLRITFLPPPAEMPE